MTQLNRRERKADQLLKHYETCERLGKYLGMEKPDGKKISTALLKIERNGHDAATAQCNGERYQNQPFRSEEAWANFCGIIRARAESALGGPNGTRGPLPGFFVNSDPRGYALKIDNETPEGKALIDAVKLHTDWGGYGILSPEIDGN